MNLEKAFPLFMILGMGSGTLIGYFREGDTLTGMANGAAIGAAVGISPMLALGIAYGFMMLWRPDTPTCICGRGKSSNYKHLSHLSQRRRDVYYYRCPNCSRQYRLADRRFDLRVSENDFQAYMVISKLGRWRLNFLRGEEPDSKFHWAHDEALDRLQFGDNNNLFQDDGLPEDNADSRKRPEVVEEIDGEEPDSKLLWFHDEALGRSRIGDYSILFQDDGLPENYADYKKRAEVVEEFDLDNPEGALCFVGVQRGSEFPFLVVAQRYSPSGFGFALGLQLVEETGLLFIGAGERLLAYDFRRNVRVWEDRADVGFSRWSRHDSTVMMSAELELAAWNLEGRKLWSEAVEPPWDYTVEDGTVRLDVMGKITSFDILQGPEQQ